MFHLEPTPHSLNKKKVQIDILKSKIQLSTVLPNWNFKISFQINIRILNIQISVPEKKISFI